MLLKRPLSLAAAGALFLLAGCGGGHDGVELGAFPAINKTEGDAPFKLTAPTSKSPAAFSYDSSDKTVATIAGDTVTILKAGTSTITAQQGRMGSYYPTSTRALLTVSPRPCVEPATRVDGVCAAPALTASYVQSGGRTWMPTSFVATWANANDYCKSTKINGSTGWRLPTEFELTQLVAGAQFAGKGWAVDTAWTSNAGTAEKQHLAVSLGTNAATSVADDSKAYVTCVQ